MQRLRTRLRASASRGAPAALSLDFLSASGALDPRITFSRGSNATLTDSTGKITYAPTNLVTNSESFDNAAWSKTTGGTGSIPAVTANADVAPDGTTTADRIVFNRGAGNTISDGSFLVQDPAVTIGVRYASSVYIKAATAGDVGKQLALRGAAQSSYTLITLTNTWQRVSTIEVAGTTAGRVEIANRGTITADNSVTALLWGAQLSPVTYQTTPGTYNSTTPKNLLGFTQEFDNAAWTKTNATVTANAVYAPDGTLTADKLVGNTAASAFHPAESGITLTAAPHVLSIYAKAGEYSLFRVAEGVSGRFYASFDLINGTVVSGTTGGTQFISAAISSVGNGWYRCSVSLTGTASTYAINFSGYPAGGTLSPYGVQYTGDGTSGIYVWGAQVSNSASLDPYVYNPAAAAASAAYYGPRFDYDPVTLAAKGLLIEEARTNLLTYSEQFDNAAWTKLNATVTANATTSPDGNTNADKLVEDATNATHVVYQGPVFAGSTTYTVSVFAKAAERSKLNVFCNGISSTAGNLFDVTFDLSNGTLSATHGTGTITPVGNGWYRCTVTNTYAATGASANIQLRLNNGSTTSYAGTAGNGLFIYGAQLEAGSFATSYIPTVASQVTRSADVATMLGDNFRSWYNLNAGTFTVDFDTPVASTYASAVVVDNGTTNNVIAIGQTVSGLADYSVADGGVAQASFQATSIASTTVKIAGAYAANDFARSLNGGTVSTDTSGTVPSVNTLRLGYGLSSRGQLNGHIRSMGYYNTRQPNATLQTLTNPSTTPSLALNFISDTYTVGA